MGGPTWEAKIFKSDLNADKVWNSTNSYSVGGSIKMALFLLSFSYQVVSNSLRPHPL